MVINRDYRDMIPVTIALAGGQQIKTDMHHKALWELQRQLKRREGAKWTIKGRTFYTSAVEYLQEH